MRSAGEHACEDTPESQDRLSLASYSGSDFANFQIYGFLIAADCRYLNQRLLRSRATCEDHKIGAVKLLLAGRLFELEPISLELIRRTVSGLGLTRLSQCGRIEDFGLEVDSGRLIAETRCLWKAMNR